MKSLILKDLYCIRGYFKQVGLVLLLMSGMGIVMRSMSVVSFMLVFMSMSLVQSCMYMDEKNKWERYALTLPIRKKDVVKSKYILLLLMGGAAEVFAILLNMTISILFHMKVLEAVVAAAVVFVVYLYVFSLSIPASFKLGADKARYIVMAVIVIPSVLLSVLVRLFPSLNEISPTDAQVMGFCLGGVLMGILLFLVSYRVSLRIYGEKEF